MEEVIITPKNDIVFKRIFGSKGNEEILKSFLEYVLDMKIQSVNLDLNTELLPDFSDGKTARVDVRAELDDGSQIDIEIQTDAQKYSEKRALYYWSKLYNSSVPKGNNYHKGRKTIGIWIVDGKVYDEFEKFHSIWKIHEEEGIDNCEFDMLEMHVIELQKFRKCDTMSTKKKDFWLWFIDYSDKEMVDLACYSEERINEARKQLEELTADRYLMLEILNRQMGEMDESYVREKIEREATAKGLAKGLAEGKLEVAKAMKKKGMSLETIVEITGLSKEEVEKIEI